MNVRIRKYCAAHNYYEGECRIVHMGRGARLDWVTIDEDGTTVITTALEYEATLDSEGDALYLREKAK